MALDNLANGAVPGDHYPGGASETWMWVYAMSMWVHAMSMWGHAKRGYGGPTGAVPSDHYLAQFRVGYVVVGERRDEGVQHGERADGGVAGRGRRVGLGPCQGETSTTFDIACPHIQL